MVDGMEQPDAIVRLRYPGAAPAPAGILDVAALPGNGTGGADELARVLSTLSPDAVVLCHHDDVELTADDAARLAQAVRFHAAAVAVPRTNDLGTDHGPVVSPGTTGTRPVRTVRPSCIAARASTLRDLVVRRLHDPLTLLTDVDIGMAVVEGTAVHHRNRCVEALRALAVGPTPPIVATLIVRDEEELLGDCLDSVRSVVDRIEVADTGSVDRTVAIAEAAGAHVLHREWRDDFAWARNEVLAEARDAAWALWIDADERLVCDDPALLRGYLRAFASEHDILELVIRNLRADGSETTRFAAPRFLRASEITFWGALHEHPVLLDAERPLRKSTIGLASIDHLGYGDELLADRGKQDRNVAVAEAAYGRDPGPKAALDLARSLSFAQRDVHRAVELYREGLAGVPEHDHRARAFVTAQLAGHLQDRVGDQEAALAEAEHGLELVPADVSCRAVLARALRALGRVRELPARAAALDARPSLIPMSSALDAQMIWHLVLAVAQVEHGHPNEAWTRAAEAGGTGSKLTAPDVADLLAVAAARTDVPPLVRLVDAVVCVAEPVSRDAVVRTIAAGFPVATVLEVMRSVLDRVDVPEAVLVGVLLAERSARPADAEWFAARAGVCDPAVSERLAARLDDRGAARLAASVRRATRSGDRLLKS